MPSLKLHQRWSTVAASCAFMSALIMTACSGGGDTGASGSSLKPGFLASVTAVNGSATFSGNRANYSIVKTATGYKVTDKVGTEGINELTAVSTLKFSDYTVNLAVADASTGIPAAQLQSLIELYIAFFNRVPDADGMVYWINQIKNGVSIDAIADSFYAVGVQYTATTGYSSKMSNDDFITKVFQNMLGRPSVDAEGMTYWLGRLAKEGRGPIVRAIIDSAHTYKGDAQYGWVATLLDNKVTVSKYIAIEQGLTYTTDIVTKSMEIAKTVSSTDTTKAIALLGFTDSTFSMTTIAPTATFFLTSTAGVDGATLPTTYTCDGSSKTPPLAWSGAPSGTKSFAVIMSTIPGPGTVKYNWLLYNIPSTVSSLSVSSTGIGTLGFSDDGGGLAYAPPCSSGAGTKTYTLTVYALSAAPTLSGYTASQVTGDVLMSAITPLKLSSASLNMNNTRTQAMLNCVTLTHSLGSYATANNLSITCDSTYAYFNTYGIQTAHSMMNGITQTILQVPTAQNFIGTNAWKIPLVPAIAATTTSAVDGPIGVAVNGIPLFNPCKQGGCSTATGGGDTKAQGELDICNGHAGRADDYHYHAAPVCMMADQPTHYWDEHPLGWALDGYAIFGYYNPDGSVATRDATCGGNTLTHVNAPAGYAYHVTDTAPYILSCFKGTPSPDLAQQGAKFAPLRVPSGPGGGAGVSNMTLSATTETLAIGGTSTLAWQQNGTSYQVLYKRTTNLCWNFIFKTNGVQTGTETDCRAF